MKIKIICLASIAFLALPVFAHEGVKNDAVKQRMQLMTVIKDTMAKIGAMARGLDPFTEESAANAKQTLLLAAADIEVKFKLNETDPLFTQWDYRNRAWEENNGVRIDHIILSPNAADKLERSWIETSLRNQEKPSDHVPVWISLSEK